MRIGVLAPPWLPIPASGYGGTEAVIDQLALGLREAGHDVILFTRRDSSCPVPRLWSAELPGPDELGQVDIALRHVVQGYEAFRQVGVDLVHDHTSVGPFVAGDLCDVPVVVTNHNRFDARANVLFGTVSDRCDVVAISRAQASTANGVRIAAIIHHGLDVEQFPIGRGDGGYLLFLGRMAPEKGVAIAARVARRAGRRLLIAAKMWEPREKQYFEDEVRPLLDDDVQYIGQAGPDRKVELLGGAAALLNPICWNEPFGMTMIESLACGTPVIARPCGAAPEIVRHGENGFLALHEDALVDAVCRVGELDRNAVRRSAERRFSTTRMVQDHVALYRSLLDGSLLTVGAGEAAARPSGAPREGGNVPPVPSIGPITLR